MEWKREGGNKDEATTDSEPESEARAEGAHHRDRIIRNGELWIAAALSILRRISEEVQSVENEWFPIRVFSHTSAQTANYLDAVGHLRRRLFTSFGFPSNLLH